MSYDIFLPVEFCWIVVVVMFLIIDPSEGFGLNSFRPLYFIIGGDNLMIWHDYMIIWLFLLIWFLLCWTFSSGDSNDSFRVVWFHKFVICNLEYFPFFLPKSSVFPRFFPKLTKLFFKQFHQKSLFGRHFKIGKFFFCWKIRFLENSWKIRTFF